MAERVSFDELSPLVSDASKQYGVPEDFIWNVIRAENSGSVKGAGTLKDASATAVSPKNARGVMQVTPIALQDVIQSGLVPSTVTHEGMTLKDQVNVGTAYLSKLLKMSQDPAEVYAMYNYGPKARFRMDQLPDETKDYVNKATQRSTTETSSGGGGTGTFGRGMLDSSDLIGMLMQSTQQQNALMQRAGETAQSRFQLGQEKAGQSIQAQQQVIQDAAVNAGAKASVEYAQNRTLEQLQQMFGLDVSQTDNEISKSLAVAQQARDARVGVRAEYDQLAGTSLLENPIGYLFAQLQLPAVAARNNALADAEDLAMQNIDTRTRQLTAAKNVISANTADEIHQFQLQQAKLEKRAAEAKLLGEEARNLVASAGTELQLAQISNQIGDNTRSALQTIISLEDREEARKLRKEQIDTALSAKKLKEEEDVRLNARLKTVSSALGLVEPMTLTRLKTLTNKKVQEAWLGAALTGQMGEDLQQSVRFYLSEGNRVGIQNGGGASVQLTAEKLDRAGASYQSLAEKSMIAANPLGKKPSNEEARTAGYKLYEQSVVASMASPTERDDLSSSAWDRVYNPYVAPFLSFNKAIAENPQLKFLQTNSVKTAIDDLVKSGAVNLENLTADQQQQVLGAVIERVSTRAISPKVAAADITAYFRGAASYNRVLNKSDLFALPAQGSYLFTVDGSWSGDPRQKVDLMNPADVENVIMKKARARAMISPFGQPLNVINFGLNEDR